MKSGESHYTHELASDVADEVRRVSLHSGAGKEEEEKKMTSKNLRTLTWQVGKKESGGNLSTIRHIVDKFPPLSLLTSFHPLVIKYHGWLKTTTGITGITGTTAWYYLDCVQSI